MARPLWPEADHQLESDLHQHRHLLLLLLSTSPSMGEQARTDLAAESIPLSSFSTAAASTGSNDLKPSSPSSPSAAGLSVYCASVHSSNPSKVSFCSTTKIRKSYTSSSAEAPAEVPVKKPRLILRVLPRPLSAPGELNSALRHLRSTDPQLTSVIDAHDPPAFHSLDTPFHSLSRSILYQQLAFKAAASIYARFISLCGGEGSVVPEAVLALTPQQLRQIGVSARKASYLHDLARKYHSGILSDSSIVTMDDKSLFSKLTMVKGIGAWSVHMFMIFSLHRPDVLPVGDLGVRKGVQMLHRLEDVPRPSQLERLCDRWRPYRSVGAWYMWRLIESKGTSSTASSGGAGGVFPVDGGSAGGENAPINSRASSLILS